MTSKLDYLKRYMEPEEPKKKVKIRKKLKSAKSTNVKIFDANVDLKDVKAGNNSDGSEDAGALVEDAPQVAAIIDERPLEMRSFSRTLKEASTTEKGSQPHISSSHHRPTAGSSADSSPVRRRQRRDSSSDESPPRRHNVQEKDKHKAPDSNGSAPRKRRDSDESPPRKRRDSDASPPRRRRNSDQSPPRNRRKAGSDSDISPPRRAPHSPADSRDRQRPGHSRHEDHSPPRRRRTNDDRGERQREIAEPEILDGPEVIKLRGSKKQEAAAAKAEQAEKEARRKAIYEQWNSGVVQRKQREQLIEDTIHEASKPLARAADDADLDRQLREVVHQDDPMLAFIRKKKQANDGRPRYNGPAPPPNRFGIWPGYRWDGVDRSNGFEAKIIATRNEKLAREEHAYKWSTEDM